MHNGCVFTGNACVYVRQKYIDMRRQRASSGVNGLKTTHSILENAYAFYKRICVCIGVARGSGVNVKPLSTYPLSKTENSSKLVHYFLGTAQIHI